MRDLIKQLNLPPEACDYLCNLWDTFHLFDDIVDKDPIERDDFDRVLWAVLVGIPTNKFFMANSQTLLPLVAAQILKWQASDIAERRGDVDERSFMWRAGYYDIVLMVYFLCYGREITTKDAAGILSIYGEKYADYKKEFKDA